MFGTTVNAVQVLGLWLLVHLKEYSSIVLAVAEINTKKYRNK